MDRLDAAAHEALRSRHPDAMLLSAHQPEDMGLLRERILRASAASMVEADLVIPYASRSRISEVYEHTPGLSEAFDASGRKLRCAACPEPSRASRRPLEPERRWH